MTDWYPPSERSSWHRIEGEGEPTDYSDGASNAGDWKGRPEPVPRPFRVAFDNPRPAPPAPAAVVRVAAPIPPPRKLDMADALRLFAKKLRHQAWSEKWDAEHGFGEDRP